MDYQNLISKLNSQFPFENMPERDWIGPMSYTRNYLTNDFKKYQNGEVFNFTTEVNQVYLSAFTSEIVVNKILEEGTENSLLVVHHPMEWIVDGELEERIPKFIELPEDLILKMKESKLSLYSLHTPLDKVGEYSTCYAFSEEFGNKSVSQQIYNYSGVYVGVIGKVMYNNLDEIKSKFEGLVGHEVALYKYGNNKINENKVGFVGGGGLKDHVIEELHEFEVNTYCTGITMNTEHNRAAHDLAKEYQINILGGTHYSTEKFALKKLSKLFQSYGLSTKFVPDKPNMKDIDI